MASRGRLRDRRLVADPDRNPGVSVLPGIASLFFYPFTLRYERYQRDPRFAAFCKKVGLPTTTDAVAMK